MATEIEKKYLISENGVDYLTEALSKTYKSVPELRGDVLRKGTAIRQGYLPQGLHPELCGKLGMNVGFTPTEARLRDKSGTFFLTLKGEGSLSRSELEIEIGKAVFDKYWPRTEGKRVSKFRLAKTFEGHTAEIDVYTDRDLIVAEIEVHTVQDAESLKPLGLDITCNERYKNKNLAK